MLGGTEKSSDVCRTASLSEMGHGHILLYGGELVYTCAPPLSVWPHLFRGAGHEKRRGEQLKWSLPFRLYIGSFPCPGPVHTARLGRMFLCVFSLGLCFVCSFVLFDLFVCPHSFMFP